MGGVGSRRRADKATKAPPAFNQTNLGCKGDPIPKRKTKKKATRRARHPEGSKLERDVSYRILLAGVPPPVREHRFHPVRRWRFDFAWPELKVALECEGGTWINGGHSRGSGFDKDCEKYNAAGYCGWRVFRLTTSSIRKGALAEFLGELFGDPEDENE